MSFDGMEQYYLTQGRNWERYAMVKARIVVGSEADKDSCYAVLNPFVYRRYLDYSTIEALADLKQKISSNLQSKELRQSSPQWNVKLGRGGIREVEFIVQSFQLVRGGRDAELQGRELIPTLHNLVSKALLSEQDGSALLSAYVFLRRTENALQAMHDQQVHTLPDNPDDQRRLLAWMGCETWEEFDTQLQQHRQAIYERFDDVFRTTPSADASPATPLDALSNHGIEADEALLASLHELSAGGLYQRLTASAQKRVDQIIPRMIEQCAANRRHCRA